MRKLLLLSSGILLATVTLGQQSQETSSKKTTWNKGLSLSVHVGQGGSRNWAPGAEKFSLWTAASFNAFANKDSRKCYWDNNLQLNYGFMNSHSTGFRKIDDKIDFTTKPGLHLFGPKLGVALHINFRSQFYDGYNNNYLNQGLKRRISGFMAPGYVHVAPGFDWKPSKSFNLLFAPVGGKFTYISNKPYSYSFQGGIIPDDNQTDGSGVYEKPLAVNYGVDPSKEARIEFGTFVNANFQREIMKNVYYRTKLDLFSGWSKRTEFFGPNFASSRKVDEFDPLKIDVYFTNSILMKVNKFLSVSYDFDIAYDDDIRMFGPNGDVAATQFRSMLGVGLSVVATIK